MSEVAQAVRDEPGSAATDVAGVGDARQFVIFHVADEMFAVPLAEPLPTTTPSPSCSARRSRA